MTNTQRPSPTDPTCALFEERLAAYLERDLDADERGVMEQHRAECTSCQLLVQDFEAIAAAATQLPVLTPSRDLWAGISDRIAAPAAELFPVVGETLSTEPIDHALLTAKRTVVSARRGVSMRVFAIAATLLIALSSAVTWRIARSPSDIATRAGRQASMDSGLETSGTTVLVTNANVVYEQEIAALRTIVNERFSELDSTTVAVLKRNLDIIDRAIAESRQALALDPTSRALSTSLERAVESKLSLMRRVALL